MRRWSLVPLLMLSSLAVAQTAPSPASDTALRLARLLLSFNEDGTSSVQCIPDQAAFGEALKRDIARNVSSYGGITPQSQYWDEVVEVNYQFRKATCRLTGEVVEHYAHTLAAKMGPAELADALAFTRSPVGRKLAQSKPDESLKKFADARLNSDKDVGEAYRNGLRALAERYKADPR